MCSCKMLHTLSLPSWNTMYTFLLMLSVVLSSCRSSGHGDQLIELVSTDCLTKGTHYSNCF